MNNEKTLWALQKQKREINDSIYKILNPLFRKYAIEVRKWIPSWFEEFFHGIVDYQFEDNGILIVYSYIKHSDNDTLLIPWDYVNKVENSVDIP